MSGSKDAFGGGARTGGGSLKNASRSNRCPICESRENFRCSIRSDGALVLCRNTSDGAVQTKMDTTGTEYYVHIINSDVPYSRESLDGQPGPNATPDPEPSSPDVVDKAYRMLLSELTLSTEHREVLRKRGLSDDEIKLRGYRSFPFTNRIAIARKLADRLGEANARGVPGLYVWTDDESGKSYWKLAGWRGLLIPLRNGSEQIVALKVRRDDNEERKDDDKYDDKYTYVSSAAYGGPRAAQSVHIPLGVRPGATVRVTEGELKADVTTVLSGVPTLSVPGVGNYPLILPRVHKPSIDLVLVAWDADHNTKPVKKPAVALSLVALCRSLQKLGKKWAIEVWDPELGKGIDDVWSAGHGAKVRRLEGEKAEAHLIALEEKYRPKPSAASVAAAETQKRADVLNARAAEELRQELAGTYSPPIDGAPPTPTQIPDPLAIGDGHELAVRMLRIVQGTSPERVLYELGSFYRYEPALGIWEKIEEEELFTTLGRFSGCPVGPNQEPLSINHGTITGAIKIAAQYRTRRDFFDQAPTGIAFKNGFVTVIEGVVTLHGHSPKHRAMYAMPFDYNPNADATQWYQFLHSIFQSSDELKALEHGSLNEVDLDDYQRFQAAKCDILDRANLLQEHIGASMIGMATAFAMALVLLGEGNNGKSVLLKVVKALFPKTSVISVAPHDWKNNFFKAEIAGKRLNAVAEMPEAELEDTPSIKAVVSGDDTMVARKNERPFTLIPKAGHLFCCNKLPTTKDMTDGFWRRFMIVMFTRKFTDADRIIGLEKILCSPENLAAVAAWAIEGAARLQRQKAYTVPQSSRDAMDLWRLDVDQVRQWFAQCAAPDATIRSRPNEIYVSYFSWAQRNGHRTPMTSSTFCRRLSALEPSKHDKYGSFYSLRVVNMDAFQDRNDAPPPYQGAN